MSRRVRALAIALPVALPVLLFIGWPLVAVLAESFRVDRPLAYGELRARTLDALARLPAADAAALQARWLRQADTEQRLDGTAAALAFLGHPAEWDRTLPFAAQQQAARQAIAALPADSAARIDAEIALAIGALHRRGALAFRLREQIGEAAFAELQAGSRRGFGLDHYRSVLADDRARGAMLGSLGIAVPTAALTTLIAFLIAWGFSRNAIPWPRTLRVVMLVPIVSPPVIMALALVLLFGRNGVVTHGLLDQTLGLIDAERFNIYGRVGIGAAQLLGFLPACFIVLDAALARIDPRVEEAAAIAGATPWQVFWRVTVPGAEPGLVRAFVLAFVFSMTDFGNPEVIGDNAPTLAGLVYDEALGFQNLPLAAALAVWLVLPALLLHGGLAWARRRRRFHGNDPASGLPALELPAAPRRVAVALVLLVALAVVLLYGAVAAGAFVRAWGFDWTPTLANFLPANDLYAPSQATRGLNALRRTAELVGIAAPVGGVLGIATAYVLDRIRPPGGAAIGFLALLPAVLPGLLFGLGYVAAFNAPFGARALSLSGTDALVALNIAFDKLFVGLLAARAALARLDPAVDEAAASLGASPLATFRLVALPLLRRAGVLGTLFVFMDGATTLSSVIFLVGPDTMLASVRIFSHASSSRYGLACALSVGLMAMVLAVVVATFMLDRHGGTARRQPA
jgi:iron(III) transport system permease protein